MKKLVGLAFFQILCQGAFGLEKSTIVGEWHVTSTSEIEDGVVLKSNELVVYREDGSYYSEGTGIVVLTESNERLLTIAGPESGTWTVKGDELRVQTTDVKIDFFSSAIPEFTREAVQKELKDSLRKPEILGFSSKDGNRIVLKDKEDDTETIMTPLSDLPKMGRPVAEAFATYTFEELGGDPTAKPGVEEDLVGERMRRTSRLVLRADGFTPSAGLPTFRKRKGIGDGLRPQGEILARLLCSYVTVTWVVATEEAFPSKALLALVEQHGLSDKMTKKEEEILAVKRAEAKRRFGETIGWKMENMWALAWVLGFDSVPDVDQGQIAEETITSLWAFLAPVAKGKGELLKSFERRPLREVAQLEDIFYCAHNAVRSAQLGKLKAVPEGFHPVIHGGTVHEKRHSLTWVLSPSISWVDTDLST